MKLILYARSLQNELFGKLGLKLISRGYYVIFITNTIIEENKLSKIVGHQKIFVLERYLAENWNNFELLSSISFSEIEMEYNISSIWSLIYTDRHLTQLNTEDAIKCAKLIISFILIVLKQSNASYFINEEIANFPAYLFYELGKKVGTKFLGICVPRNFSDSKIAFTDNNHSTYYDLNNCYHNRKISEEKLEQAKNFVDSFREHRSAPEYMKISGKYPKFKINYLFHLLKYLIAIIGKHETLKKASFDFERFAEKPHKKVAEFRNYLKFKFQKKYYNYHINNQKYLLFPLHFQPEATTLVLAQNYEKQLNAIDLIAKKIPGEYMLYVKEHYARLGHREIGFYKAIRKYPNVLLINPLMNIHDLIIKSEGVITLSGTAGWEAILWSKPVFLLGNVFYESFKYIIKIENINELTSAIKNTDFSFYKSEIYQHELNKYVACYLQSLKNGNYLLGSADYLTENNVENLCISILNEL